MCREPRTSITNSSAGELFHCRGDGKGAIDTKKCRPLLLFVSRSAVKVDFFSIAYRQLEKLVKEKIMLENCFQGFKLFSC